MDSSASSLLGRSVDASSLLSGGFVGSILGAMPGGEYAAGASGGALQGLYGQPLCSPSFGRHQHPATWAPQQQGGTMTQGGQGQPIDYTTSGGYKITIDASTVTVTDPYGRDSVQECDRRLLLGDATRLTINAPPGQKTIIVDGSQVWHIDNDSGTITSVSSLPYQNDFDDESLFFGLDFTGDFLTSDHGPLASLDQAFS